MFFHGASLLNAALAVCASSLWADAVAPGENAPVPPSPEHLPLAEMLVQRRTPEGTVPVTAEDCDRYLAAGRLANDPCALKTGRDSLGLVPDAAWKEEKGWKAVMVHLDGAVSPILFNEEGMVQPLHPVFCRVTVDQRSSTVVRLGYGAWKIGKTKALYRTSYRFDPQGKGMGEICDVSLPDGRNFNEWTFSHKPEGPFSCRDDSWTLSGLRTYTRHTWNVQDGCLRWWKIEEIPLPRQDAESAQRNRNEDGAIAEREGGKAVYVCTLYFPEKGSSHPSVRLHEDVERKELRCLFYDASGHGTALMVYRNGVLDREQSWFLQPRMDAAAVAAREKHARSGEERRMLKFLYRFAPYAEKEPEKSSVSGVARLNC